MILSHVKRWLGFVTFAAVILALFQSVRLTEVAQMLQQPITQPLSVADATEPPQEPDPAKQPIQAQVRAHLPEKVPTTTLALANPALEADLVHLSQEQTEAIAPEDPPKEEMAEVLPAESQTEEIVAHIGDQAGAAVPELALDYPSTRLTQQMLESGDMMLWLQIDTDRKVWFAPSSSPQTNSVAAFVRAGRLFDTPTAAGLQVQAASGGKLRQLRLHSGNKILPLFFFSDVALRDIGAVQVIEGGLIMSPELEARMIAAQQDVLDVLGFNRGDEADWPPSLQMVGCWDGTGQFSITETVDRDTQETLYQAAPCAA